MNRYEKKMSIIMPAYNEGENIYHNLLETEKIVSGFCDSFEIVCVNDGSKDNTKEEILRAEQECMHVVCVTYDDNMGKGHAIKAGVSRAEGEYIAFLDADLDLSPRHLESFLKEIQRQEADIAIGSKMHPDSVLDYPLSRKIVSRGYYCILLVLFRLNVHDTQTGIKLFQAELLKSIIVDVQTSGFAYDIEILAMANELGAKIIEMPVTIQFTREKGFSRIKLKDIITVFTDTMKIRGKITRYRRTSKQKEKSKEF